MYNSHKSNRAHEGMSNVVDTAVLMNRDETRLKVAIILNLPITELGLDALLLTDFFIICDGGANRIHDLTESANRIESKLTTLCASGRVILVGDADSISNESQMYFKNKFNLSINVDNDLNTTDFQKALNIVQNEALELRELVVLGAVGGRLDHTISALHTLTRFAKQSDLEISSYNPIGILKILTKPQLIVLPNMKLPVHCGYWNMAGSTIVSTSGFVYDVTDYKCDVRTGKFSTSNVLLNSQVKFDSLDGDPLVLYFNTVEDQF